MSSISSHPNEITNWKIWVRLAFFLAIALVVQSIRLVVPLPGPVNMFLIGSLLNAVMLLAVWQTRTLWACVMAFLLPLGAFLEGQLPLVVMVPVVGLGNACLMVWAYVYGQRRLIFAGPVIKAAVLYGGTWLVIGLVQLPGPMAQILSFMMSWPQIVTGCIGIVLAKLMMRRL